ncbi:hypothetical protein B0H16DRAFT_1470066 [Mycena metata]|uniref:Uncharacterized protein n=1 Tax=Mycena metata TaxID=1033252 RepID=A0AAD7MRX5_9AGAR|nr:hypothetical protein B0H16DRAFT_1470066 [Mycena metata]
MHKGLGSLAKKKTKSGKAQQYFDSNKDLRAALQQISQAGPCPAKEVCIAKAAEQHLDSNKDLGATDFRTPQRSPQKSEVCRRAVPWFEQGPRIYIAAKDTDLEEQYLDSNKDLRIIFVVVLSEIPLAKEKKVWSGITEEQYLGSNKDLGIPGTTNQPKNVPCADVTPYCFPSVVVMLLDPP